ncbi:uncharacterized protein LOC123557348 isoform X2 [Mercenaria mercenaria]|uniref:uncharacterized protein LOC123557348 isoform X2 n=1 Tax=Mercenaria mercenaria TaxID=6596 RepID=UPI00234ED3B8|nr:uncharacterized protein LOC123557348 isoform X2 [Mercenaria mercenaria]
MKYMKYKDLKIQHLESDAVQHEHKIGMLENVLEIQKSKLNELRTDLENSQRNKREKLKLFGRNEEEMPSLCSTTESIHPDRKLEKEKKELKSNRTAEACKQTSEQISGNQDQPNDARNNQGKTKLTEADDDTVRESGENVLCEPDAETQDKDRQSEGQEKESTKGDVKKTETQGTTTEPVRPNRKLEKENKELKIKVQEKEEMLAMLKQDLEEKEKLSEMAGRRLTDNNPNIADLSDLNRPTKLAEKYAELYDNDWTDAFSYLENLAAYKGSERTVITALMTMLTTAYKMSLKTAENQLQALYHILSDFHGTTLHHDQQVKDVIKQLKGQRKRAIQPSKDLTEKYRKEIEKAFPELDSSLFESDALKLYLQKCLELCWLMAIQDPPVHLKCEGCKKGDRFDKNMFKEFTQAGPFIIYTVWPAVFLEKDGALLCKGVVQCAKLRSRSFRSSQEKTVIRVPMKSASVRVTGTQALTTVHSDKVDRGTIVVTEDGHSEKRNSQTATDVDSTDLRIQESETRITQL